MKIGMIMAFLPLYLVVVATPGPAVAAAVSRALVGGFSGSLPFVLGITVGDFFWFLAAVFGLSALVMLYEPIFIAIQCVGVIYLCAVAGRMWRDRTVLQSGVGGLDSCPVKTFFGALTLALGNPQTILFYAAVMPLVVAPQDLSLIAILTLGGLVVSVRMSVFFFYIAIAHKVGSFLSSEAILRRVRRGASLMMLGTAVSIFTR